MLTAERFRRFHAFGMWMPGAMVALACLLTFSLGTTAWGQDEEEEEDKTVAEETLDTKDGVGIACTYYKALGKGKETAPVIIVHGDGEQRTQYDKLARFLQQQGHAVIVPDLRGHGESTTNELTEKTIDPKLFGRKDYEAMVTQDMEAVKTFLKKENNDGQLNINLLTVVGVETGAIIAMQWAFWDWHWPQLARLQQGQDVKALVLISIPKTYNGFTPRQFMADQRLRKDLSVMIIAGKQDRVVHNVSSGLHRTLLRYHGKPPADKEERKEKQDLFFFELDTALQGSKLVDATPLKVDGLTHTFIKLRLLNKLEDDDDLAWRTRR